ncbi:MAG: type II toxin-antitoxin system HicB family antitoxin [Halobacteria archaeon]|nr:type II toxin-antitoxin system HicB family antitoxin [Halobacteria archaeon]
MSTETRVRRTIRLTQDEETELWTAVDEDEGVASQGETREEALENLDEAVALHKGEIGEEISEDEQEEVLRELGIEPDELDGDREPPEFMK